MPESATKQCTACGQVKPVSEFHVRRASRDGLCPECKDCKAARGRQHYEDNREKLLAQMREYHQAHLDTSREQSRRWQREHREVSLAEHVADRPECGSRILQKCRRAILEVHIPRERQRDVG